jgi:hypothetical protein
MANNRILALSMLILLSTPVWAQSHAVYCFGGGVTCEYLEDWAFEDTSTSPWYYSSGSSRQVVTDTCAYNATTGAAALAAGGYVYQNAVTDNFPYWTVGLDVYKSSTNVTSSDSFTVTVASYTDSESFTIYASDISGLCASPIAVPLSHNWGNQYVSVSIQRNSASTSAMYIDNVTLFGSYISH